MFVLEYANGSLVGLDTSSGGYPWEAYVPGKDTALNGVKFFVTREDAEKYSRGQFTVKKFEFKLLPIA
jgi:hypothetical protein